MSVKNKTWIIALLVLCSIMIVAVPISGENSVNIQVPENRVYFNKLVPNFTVQGEPLLFGYELDDEETKWFFVKDGHIAPVFKKEWLGRPPRIDRIYLPGLPSLGLFYLKNESNKYAAKLGLIDGLVARLIVYRNTTTDPSLDLGRDLEIYTDYAVYPIGFSIHKSCPKCAENQAIEIAVVKKSDFHNISGDYIYELDLSSLSLGRHNLTAYTIDKEGVKNSFLSSFTIADKINILSPENKTYFDKDLGLKFEVEERPILIAFQLDNERLKWFMINGTQNAPALKGISNSPCALQEMLACDFVINEYEGNFITPKIAISPYYNNTYGGLSVKAGLLEQGVFTEIVVRTSTSSPPLKMGADLEVSDEYMIKPLSYSLYNVSKDNRGVTMEFAAAKRQDFTNLTNETLFEFDVSDISYGWHNLTVFFINKNGVENSLSTSFTVNEPDVIVLANSIDYANATDLLNYLKGRGFTVLRVTSENFPDYRNKSIIIILGGPDAPEGVGEIVQQVLNESEQGSLRENGSRKMFVKRNVLVENQIVIVMAGSNRQYTKDAHEKNRFYAGNRLLTKDLNKTGKTWVETYPIQCGGNPWEQWWMKTNGSSQEYYKNPKRAIWNYYFKEHHIVISEIETRIWEDVFVCMSCDCPAGYTLYLQVYNPDVYKMLDLGYQISGEPPT